MTNTNPNNPTLTFDGNTYDITTLTDEVKQTVSALQIAEQQVNLYRDSLNVMTFGRNTLSSQLAAQLQDVEPLVVSADVAEDESEDSE